MKDYRRRELSLEATWRPDKDTMVKGTFLVLTKKLFEPHSDIYDAYKVRTVVFVDEQGFSMETEKDDNDAEATHVVFYNKMQPIATGRTFPDRDRPGVFIIGRVAVLRDYRGIGIGRLIIGVLEGCAHARGATIVELGAQERAINFYLKCGYEPFGEIYDEEGCPHRHMRRNLDGE